MILAIILLALVALCTWAARRAQRREIDAMPDYPMMRDETPQLGRPQPAAKWVEPERGVVIARRPTAGTTAGTVFERPARG